jgi:hypothetical protein
MGHPCSNTHVHGTATAADCNAFSHHADKLHRPTTLSSLNRTMHYKYIVLSGTLSKLANLPPFRASFPPPKSEYPNFDLDVLEKYPLLFFVCIYHCTSIAWPGSLGW